MHSKRAFSLLFLLLLAGCFRVGRLPVTTASGPGYDDPNSAVLIPKGSETYILAVNGEAVHSDFLDRLANLSLNLLLMYLEPQVYVKPGENALSLRGLNSSSVNYGTVKVTTTRWRDYLVRLNAAAGKRYLVRADVDSGTSIALDEEQKPVAPTALAANNPPIPEVVPVKSVNKRAKKSAKKAASAKEGATQLPR